MSIADSIYQNAAAETGRSEQELRKLAETVFATMLFHSAVRHGKLIISGMIISADGRIEVEVNTLPRSGRSTIFDLPSTKERDGTNPTTTDDHHDKTI